MRASYTKPTDQQRVNANTNATGFMSLACSTKRKMKIILGIAFGLWSASLYSIAVLQHAHGATSGSAVLLGDGREFVASARYVDFDSDRAAIPLQTDAAISRRCSTSMCCHYEQHAVGLLEGRNAEDAETSKNGGNVHRANYGRLPSKQYLWQHAKQTLIRSFRQSDLSGIPAADAQQQRYDDWLEQIFHLLSPHQLNRSRKTPPDPAVIREIHSILQQQWEHQQKSLRRTNDARPSRPLRIAVFGGSVTAGHDWEKSIPIDVRIAKDNVSPTQQHAWPVRLESIINAALGFEAVSVLNIAVSATTSDVGSLILEYGLFPPDYPPDGPDIIISAFATNDVRSGKTSRGSRHMAQMQDFIRKAQELRCGPLPMVVMLNDIGVWPGPLDGPMRYDSQQGLVASWNHVMGISYGDVIRDIVLANPHSTDFNNEWMPDPKAKRRSTVNGWSSQSKVHPGLGYHVALAWVVAYNFFVEAYDHCQQELDGMGMDMGMDMDADIARAGGNDDVGDGRNRRSTFDLIRQNEKLAISSSSSNLKAPPDGPLPPLSSLDMDTRTVLDGWERSAQEWQDECKHRKDGQARKVCSFAWVSNRLTQMGTVQQVEDLIFPLITSNDGWIVDGVGNSGDWLDKVGLEATKANARFVLQHTNGMGIPHVVKAAGGSKIDARHGDHVDDGSESAAEVRHMVIIALHSYGSKWEGSKLEVKVRNKNKDANTASANKEMAFHLEGHHRSRTSILVPYKFDLAGAARLKPGETLEADFELVGGSAFKILGLAFCSR